MMNEQRIFDSRIVETQHEGSLIVGLRIGEDHYMVKDRFLRRSLLTNGKVKRMVCEYDRPIFLFYRPSDLGDSHYRVDVLGMNGDAPNKKWSFESVDHIISYYTIRPELLEIMLNKLAL